MLKPLISISAFLWVSTIYGQTPILEAYVQEGLQNNLQLVQEKISMEQRWATIQEAKGTFLPSISLQSDYTLAGGGRTIALPIGDMLNPIYNTLNQITGTSDFPTQIENVEEQFLPNNFHDTKIRIIQPILNTDLYHNLNIKHSELAAQEAQLDAFKNQLVKDIKVAYFNYLQSEKVTAIYTETEHVLREMLRVNQKLVANQQATKDVVYRSELEISQLGQQQAYAQETLNAARNYFNFLLHRPLDTPIEIDTTLTLTYPFIFPDHEQALQQRQELRQIRNVQQANQEALAMYRHRRLPTLSGVLDIGYQGYEYQFNNEQDYWLAAFSFKWDLFTGFQNRSKIQQLTLQDQYLEKQLTAIEQQIQLEVADHQYQVKTAHATLQAAQKGVLSAEENFKIISRKYEQQQATLLELLDARSANTQAQLQATIAQYDLLKKISQLESSFGLAYHE